MALRLSPANSLNPIGMRRYSATLQRKLFVIRKIQNDVDDLQSIRKLFSEYQDFIEISLCFQSFEEELDSLPGKYSSEHGGCLYLAEHDSQPAGCVAFYKIDNTTCELKRLFVRPEFHKLGLGRKLMETAIHDATDIGYQTMILDTLRRLESAGQLYQRLGFFEIEPYNVNPHADVAYYSKPLA